MLNLVINEKNHLFCCIGRKGKIHPSYLVKSDITIITLQMIAQNDVTEYFANHLELRGITTP